MGQKKVLGFTLIELMVACAIVAVLAMVAYPSYTSHLKKGRRASAQAALLDIAQRQKQYFVDTRSYAVDNGGTPAYTTLKASVGSDVTFEDRGGKTLYTARALHWTKEDCETHEKMGFHQGWGIATDQMATLARTL